MALLVGVDHLAARVVQHCGGLIPGFTRRYGVPCLVRYEAHDTSEAAIVREKRLRGWRRAWTIELIDAHNDLWDDPAFGLGLSHLAGPVRRELAT